MRVVGDGLNTGILVIRLPILEGIKQCKCMMNLKDLSLIVHCLRWQCSDPCDNTVLGVK